MKIKVRKILFTLMFLNVIVLSLLLYGKYGIFHILKLKKDLYKINKVYEMNAINMANLTFLNNKDLVIETIKQNSNYGNKNEYVIIIK